MKSRRQRKLAAFFIDLLIARIEPIASALSMTEKRLISSNSPFERDYGYSRAVVEGNWVFVSGTTGYDYSAMVIPDDITDQAEQCWATIADALKEAGASLENIVRCNYYVTDASYAEPVLKVCGRVLEKIRPAATIVVVAGLLKPEMKVEIQVTALK
jgi:Putative translation initiation inhibitor, yjgF family